ncbi:MAG: DUF4359 domain-containing protein [Acidimicrobiales bacterium]
MKQISIILILISALGLLAYTNPSQEKYENFMNQEIIKESRKANDPMAGALGSLFGGIAASLIARQTIRHDYVFFSTYEMTMGGENFRAVGVLNNFHITESPQTKSGK